MAPSGHSPDIQKKKDTGILNPVQLVRLSQQITELTEEIEELKFRRSELQSRLHCDSDQEMKSYEAYIGRMSQNLERLEQQREALMREIDSQADQFRETKTGVDPDDTLPLMDARLMISGLQISQRIKQHSRKAYFVFRECHQNP